MKNDQSWARSGLCSNERERAGAMLLAVAVMGLGTVAGCGPTVTEVAASDDILPFLRASVDATGNVIVVTSPPTRLLVGNGSTSTTIDLSAAGFEIPLDAEFSAATAARAGDIIFVGDHTSAAAQCSGGVPRGVYRVATTGGPVTTVYEACPTYQDAEVRLDVAMSPNGTVAFSSVSDGVGAIFRAPITGPATVLRAASGAFFNSSVVDVNDAGRVLAGMEYSDMNHLWRGIFAFESAGQDLSNVLSVVDLQSVAFIPPLAINASGLAAYENENNTAIYTVQPTPYGTPKSPTLIADNSGAYCRFGQIDLGDDGVVIFEAALTGQPTCTSGFAGDYDGIFRGPNPSTDTLIARGDTRLGPHASFDKIRLGRRAGDVLAFTTHIAASSSPVPQVFAWRYTLPL